ncbi:MAG: crossover junction endodeoxyribonuclease RuvC [Helicobacteraceae bacterium]|nr:crossover junction endodeoxyribonuclease RuvC [Helicobacteraceae bacterium]
MNILGIDPGSKNCGYAIINGEKNKINLIEAGFIKIKTTDFKEQILELINGLDLIFKSKNIDSIAIENIFYAYNPKSVLKLAQFRGAIICKIMQEFGNFYEYTPLQIKKSITGNGKADKIQVSFMVRKILGIKNEIKPLDITDAIAIAITHHNCNK